jgi:hypothetical protein
MPLETPIMEYLRIFLSLYLYRYSIMQQLTVNIPDNKIAFFIDLAKNLGFTIENSQQKNVLTQRPIDLVNEARKQIKENPGSFLDWEEASQKLKA